jgi:hypothetical protein
VLSLERAIWRTWKEVAPWSTFKKADSLKDLQSKFLQGEADATAESIRLNLKRLKNVGVAIPFSLALFTHRIAELYTTTLAPDAIKQTSSQGGLLVSKEVAWWKQYEQAAWGPELDDIESLFRKTIAEIIEEILKGL